MKPFFRFAILSLTLVVVALVSALTAMRFAIHGQEVEVPAIIGLSPSDAGRLVAGLGLQLDVERQYYSPQIPEGRIMSQLPLPGAKVRRGWQVRAAQSLGPQRVAIPDVTKESERAAEWNIRRRGLDLASTAEMQLPGTPADQVLAQSPAGKRESGSSSENQLAGYGGIRFAGLCDAEFLWGNRWAVRAARSRMRASNWEREHGASAAPTAASAG
jgi:beta-lactam-binding protein with PASTA domain